MVPTLLAAAALAAPSCTATTVQYVPVKHPGFSDVPWVLARPRAAGVVASLPGYAQALRDGRVNRSDGLVLWTSGARIVWNVAGTVTAQRLDRPGRFRIQTELRFPAPGCWRLTNRTHAGIVSIVARVVRPPKMLRCAATPLESGKAIVRPRASGIRGGWPWQTSGPATLTTHGHKGDLNMKVLWSVRRNWGASLELVGTRLDDSGTFRQEFPMAISPVGFYPSIVDVPAAGCWLFRLRIDWRLAGVIVVRAVDDTG